MGGELLIWGLALIALLAAAMGASAALVRRVRGRSKTEELLRDRYERGEIDREEYERLRK